MRVSARSWDGRSSAKMSHTVAYTREKERQVFPLPASIPSYHQEICSSISSLSVDQDTVSFTSQVVAHYSS